MILRSEIIFGAQKTFPQRSTAVKTRFLKSPPTNDITLRNHFVGSNNTFWALYSSKKAFFEKPVDQWYHAQKSFFWAQVTFAERSVKRRFFWKVRPPMISRSEISFGAQITFSERSTAATCVVSWFDGNHYVISHSLHNMKKEKLLIRKLQ